VLTGFIWLRMGSCAGFREHGNEPSCPIKGINFLIMQCPKYFQGRACTTNLVS